MGKKLTIEEMHEIAKSRDGECLSEEYVNCDTKLQWKCRKGHEWLATGDSIRQGSWCPKCFGKFPLTIEEMHEIAKSRGGECLSKEYINNNTKLIWKCKDGHIWKAKPAEVTGKIQLSDSEVAAGHSV